MIVAAAQISPVLLDRTATLEKVLARAQEAAAAGARLVAFPEAIVPGYPTWLARTGGAAFDDPLQKELHARYLDQGVELPGRELGRLREFASDTGVTLVVGVVERSTSGGSLYATALTVHPGGAWTAHRKLVPTYEERLAWAPGDGAGLVVHAVGGWKLGVLNCWENWMPAARLALYAQGAQLFVSLWPGSPALTSDISRFTAREGRVWVLAASGVLRADELPADLPAREALARSAEDGLLHTGGSRLVGPDGALRAALDEPREGLLVGALDRAALLGERQNFDPAGHYARPDVLRLTVDRARRATLDEE
jgi:nitrilase